MLGTWSYDPTDLATSSKDAVRFLIQDVQTTRQLVFDEEINWVITQEANIYMAAGAICRSLVARAGNIKSKKSSELSITYDPEFYQRLAMKLEARGMCYQVPFCGGISQGDKLALEMDPDWVRPAIMRNLDDNASAPQPSTPPVSPIASPGVI